MITVDNKYNIGETHSFTKLLYNGVKLSLSGVIERIGFTKTEKREELLYYIRSGGELISVSEGDITD